MYALRSPKLRSTAKILSNTGIESSNLPLLTKWPTSLNCKSRFLWSASIALSKSYSPKSGLYNCSNLNISSSILPSKSNQNGSYISYIYASVTNPNYDLANAVSLFNIS